MMPDEDAGQAGGPRAPTPSFSSLSDDTPSMGASVSPPPGPPPLSFPRRSQKSGDVRVLRELGGCRSLWYSVVVKLKPEPPALTPLPSPQGAFFGLVDSSFRPPEAFHPWLPSEQGGL